jgi:hypothetical protein
LKLARDRPIQSHYRRASAFLEGRRHKVVTVSFGAHREEHLALQQRTRVDRIARHAAVAAGEAGA